jgi:hypothetical protein
MSKHVLALRRSAIQRLLASFSCSFCDHLSLRPLPLTSPPSPLPSCPRSSSTCTSGPGLCSKFGQEAIDCSLHISPARLCCRVLHRKPARGCGREDSNFAPNHDTHSLQLHGAQPITQPYICRISRLILLPFLMSSGSRMNHSEPQAWL